MWLGNDVKQFETPELIEKVPLTLIPFSEE